MARVVIRDRRPETGGRGALAPEGLNRLQRIQAFTRRPDGVGKAILRRGSQFAHPASEQEDRRDHKRKGQQHQPGQFRAYKYQQHQGTDQGQQVTRCHRDRRRHQALDDGDVGGQPRQHFAGAGLQEIGRVQRQDMGIGRLAQVGHDPLADLGDKEEPHGRGGG